MRYEEEQVLGAFKIYAQLAAHGSGDKEELRLYFADDMVRGLVNRFAKEVDCTVITAGSRLYLIPLAVGSPFHVSNDTLKRTYLTAKSVNADIYLMYAAIIVLFGEFYDSYQTTEPTRDFLPVSEWLLSFNQRIQSLRAIAPEDLEQREREYEYNWRSVIEKWEALDDLRETVRSQDARTTSRLSFLYTVKRFLEAQGLIADIGEQELALTEKAKIIIQRYYMDVEHNRGIVEFMYQLDLGKER